MTDLSFDLFSIWLDQVKVVQLLAGAVREVEQGEGLPLRQARHP